MVIGQGWEILVREKEGRRSWKGEEAEGTKIKGLLPLSTADNLEEPTGDMAAREVNERCELLEVAMGDPPT